MMSRTSLVRASRDGDQFHYLWAARRCLQLLSGQTDLVAVSIEGPSPEERADTALGAGEEVIDIGEYFGSEEVATARLVRYMQLKHSTLRASEPWSASGLQKTIEGFAIRYRRLLETFSEGLLASKLEFWFVTNRPIAKALVEAVADIASGAACRHEGELRKLVRFAGLKGNALTAFAKLLHFEDRQDDYWDQRNILFQDVTGYLPGPDVDAPTRLKELVTRRALSEGARNPTITKMDVLRALNTDESHLFPANPLSENLDTAVPRTQEQALVREILSARVPVIIHASAGVGKTVFATRIGRSLPQGSVCILYDCFGNGQYRNASGYRHRHRDALVQVANELSTRSLCHPLIPTPQADASGYIRAFVSRVVQAATLLRLTCLDAVLCIVVDAADNAQMAAEEAGETRSFVRDLIRERLPSNVRLVFLCRTHRQNYLDPPAGILRYELRPFSRDETSVHLRHRFPHASNSDIDEFHRLSSSNPRVQALALARNNSLPETLRLLGPNPTSVDDTIANLLEKAVEHLKDSLGMVEKAQVARICTGLAALRPLIPIPVLSRISGVEESAIRSFAIDLGRPLLVAGDTIQFIDEPAETWFRERFRPQPSEMQQFLGTLKPLAATSAYVAAALPQLMLEAGNFAELVELALASTALPEASVLERRHVELQRLQMALKAGLRARRYGDAAKLALKAGGEMAGGDRQRQLLQANTDLGGTFLTAELIQDIVSRRVFGSGWVGSHHAYEAALLSGNLALVGDARSRLRMAYEWLGNWSRLSPEERREEEITDQDIAALTLAELNIHGPASAAKGLRQWRPRDVSFRVGRTVARSLVDHGRTQEVEEVGRAADNNLWLVLAIGVELRAIGRTLPIDVTRRVWRLAATMRVKVRDTASFSDGEPGIEAVTALVAAALHHAICSREEASAVLTRYLPGEPPRTLASRFTKERRALLEAYSLRAALQGHTLEVRELAHADLRAEMDKASNHSRSRELEQFQEDVGALLPWCQLWASATLGNLSKGALHQEVQRTRSASEKAPSRLYRDEVHTSNEIATLWIEVLHKVETDDLAALSSFIEWKDALTRPLFTPTLTSLARLCGQRRSTQDVALRLALEAFTITKDERSHADTKAEGYIDAARAILAVSKSEAEAYFNEAVEVASKIGDENLPRWDAILYVADRAARLDRPSPESAYRLARCAELTYEYVARDKHFNWRATIEALCGLCPSSVFAILSRWRDRGFGSAGRVLPIAVQRLIDQGSVEARDALALIGYRAPWAFDQLLDRLLADSSTPIQQELATGYLYRYMQFGEEGFAKLKDVVARHGVTIAGLDEAVVAEKEREAHREELSTGPHGVPSSSEQIWDDVFGTRDLTSTVGLSESYAAFKRTEPPFYNERFFEQAIKRLAAGSEAAFIKAVSEVPEFDLYHLRYLLEQAPPEWKARPATRHALKAIIKAYSRRHCMEIARNRYYEVFPFKAAYAIADVSEAEIAQVVLDSLGEIPDFADSDRLFSLVGLIASKLSEEEALQVLNYGLGLFTPLLEDRDGDGPWSLQLQPPADVTASIAGYIWASMGMPEASLRWEGSHAVLGLAALERKEVLGHLVKLALAGKGGPFVDSRLPYYGLHALQWFLIGVSRAATQFPSSLAPFADQLVEWALKDQSHVMIRQFAARGALALINHGVLAGEDILEQLLTRINISPFPAVESKFYDRERPKPGSSTVENDDYYFGFDIGPYWYEPLGRVFALHKDEVESEALKVIRTKFGYSAKGRWDEDERSKRKIYKDESTYHSHGSYPRADSLHFYHAYHAMMIVAGNLLSRLPTHRDPGYSQEDDFAQWLARHDLSRSDGRWLWDRRDPGPLGFPRSWDKRDDEDAWGEIALADLDRALHAGAMLNVWGHWTTANSSRQEGVYIRSALVTPKLALALLRALETARDVHDYALPSFDSDLEIDKSGFVLKGWIVDQARERGIDEQDPWAAGITFPPPRPANFITDLLSLETDAEYRLWTTRNEAVAMRSCIWGHYDEGNRYDPGNPDRGSKVEASLSFLTSMLGELGQDLIIQVQIDRHRRQRLHGGGVDNDKERIPSKARLYLLGADGRFRTV